MKTCFICGEDMFYGNACVTNYKWGDKLVSQMEEAKAYTCMSCGEMLLEKKEVKRLQELSKHY